VSDGCAVDQATSTVVVYAAPSAGQDGTINVCLNEPFVLWNGLAGNIDANGIWYNASNNPLSSAQDTAGALAGQFNYDYIVTSSVCPNDTSNVLVIVDGSCDFTAALDEFAAHWEIYPNPANEYVEVRTDLDGNSEIELLDLHGKVILHSQMFNKETKILLGNIPAGVYMLNIKNANVAYTERIIIQ
jgi:hypothetical protein